MNAPVYLDYNATTPVDPRVAKVIEPYLCQHFGNPSSTHVYGRNAHQAVELARQQLARLIAAEDVEIVFTGCATEANNLAIRGVARALRDKGRHLVTSAVEHPAVEQPMQRLPNTLNISFPGVDGRDLLAHAADEVAASVGSACHEEGDAVSGVLGTMGIEIERARGAVRLSLGTPSTDAEIERASNALIAAWRAQTD
ncbi:MAG: aminotransferase class V-fold PLP-dependent enzyme [Gammaproteobacteria bacterium]|nr:aminotransferase class V-fold PLP-dependent enzyme [Gammaproteobacteria bacterium]